jgi:hypothetical protein
MNLQKRRIATATATATAACCSWLSSKIIIMDNIIIFKFNFFSNFAVDIYYKLIIYINDSKKK